MTDSFKGSICLIKYIKLTGNKKISISRSSFATLLYKVDLFLIAKSELKDPLILPNCGISTSRSWVLAETNALIGSKHHKWIKYICNK